MNFPDDVDSEFSPPVMITGASLRLTKSLENECKNLAYSQDPPSMRETFEIARSHNRCGDVTVNVCVRMSLKSTPFASNYIYKKVPNLNIKYPCSGDSFIGAAIEVSHVDFTENFVSIDLSAKKSVLQMKFLSSQFFQIYSP